MHDVNLSFAQFVFGARFNFGFSWTLVSVSRACFVPLASKNVSLTFVHVFFVLVFFLVLQNAERLSEFTPLPSLHATPVHKRGGQGDEGRRHAQRRSDSSPRKKLMYTRWGGSPNYCTFRPFFHIGNNPGLPGKAHPYSAPGPGTSLWIKVHAGLVLDFGLVWIDAVHHDDALFTMTTHCIQLGDYWWLGVMLDFPGGSVGISIVT